MQHSRTGINAKIVKSKVIIDVLLKDQNTVVCSTKFGSNSVVFLHLVTSLAPDVPIIWVDTGYNCRDTMSFVNEATNHMNLNLHTFRPKDHTIQIPPAIGSPEHGEFAETVKLAPFRRALKTLGATHWISSVRSYQTPNRNALPTTVKMSKQMTKVHPMLDWSESDMLAYRSRHSLPAGPVAYDPTKGGSMGECGLHKVSSFF